MTDQRLGARLTRASSRLVVTTVLGLVAFSGTVMGQETVIIGGSGQSSVEVNLDALRDLDGRGNQRALRHPGEDAGQAVVLRAPAGVARAIPTPRNRPAPATAPVASRPSVAAPVAPVVRAPAPPPPAAPAAPRPQETATAAPARVTPPAPPPAPPVARETTPPPAVPPRVTAPAPAAPRQTAALPPANLPAEGQALRLLFEGSSTQLSDDAQQRLRQMAAALAANEQRVQLKAFASGTSDRPSAARRESLSRALAVRSYLIENGVRSTRIDVRALGAPSDGGPNDRVDVILLTQ